MPLSEKIQQINREISATVERVVADLRQEMSQRLRAGHDEILRRLDEITPELPGTYVPEELGAEADELARQSAAQAVEEAETAASGRTTGARSAAFTAVRDALASIDRARTQAEILAAVLREAGRFSSRAAILLWRGTELRGWGGQGFGDAEPAIRDLALTPAPGSGWAKLGDGQAAVHLSAAECAELCSRIEAPLPHDGVLIPLVLRDRVAAGLYADRLSDELAAEALQTLCYAAAMAIELLPFRERPFTPTLVLEGGPAGPDRGGFEAAPAPEAPEPEPEPEPEPIAAAPEPEPEPSSWTAEPEPVPEPEPDQRFLAAEPEPEPWMPPAEPPVPVFDEAPAYETDIEVEAVPEEPEPASEPEPEPSISPAATVYQPISAFQTATQSFPSLAPEPAPAPVAAAPAGGAEPTVLLPRTPFGGGGAVREPEPAVEAPAPPPLRPVPAAEPAPSAAGGDGATPEVRPPTGVEGPGWAFSASRAAVSPSEEALHEEARRLARLLVSEIKLYNEEQVEEGRRRRDVYERLKEDIDRSRQMYEERVEPRILKSTDYFYQELVRILAAGDAKALGI